MMLVALFERSYVVAYEDNLTKGALRRWNSWGDYMREWCRREDFYFLLPQLQCSEHPRLAARLRGVADGERYACLARK